MKKGIDVSGWQKNIDWAKVKSSGIDFAILKCGGSDTSKPYKDSTFEYNYANAKAVGIKVGVYYFVGKNFFIFDDAVANANHCISILNGRQLDLPVYVDIEAPPTGRKAELTDAALAFLGTIQQAGYKMGVYGSDISGFKNRMDYNTFLLNPDISIWVARYGSKPKYATKWDIWQNSSSGSVPGISGRVDTDVTYIEELPQLYYLNGLDYSPVFDPVYYANRYPDLMGAFGLNAQALWNHFTLYGMNELRRASEEFDPVFYKNTYHDLYEAYGDDNPSYYKHYVAFGKNEGRKGAE